MNKGTAYQTEAGFEIGHAYAATGSEIAISDGTNKTQATITFDSGYRPPDFQNKWTHFVFVFDRIDTGKAYAYVNGVRQSGEVDISSVAGSIDTAQAMNIGSIYGWQTDGILDDVRIYNYARTAEQILQDYNAGAAARLGD